jgi:hypothetical protein
VSCPTRPLTRYRCTRNAPIHVIHSRRPSSPFPLATSWFNLSITNCGTSRAGAATQCRQLLLSILPRRTTSKRLHLLSKSPVSLRQWRRLITGTSPRLCCKSNSDLTPLPLPLLLGKQLAAATTKTEFTSVKRSTTTLRLHHYHRRMGTTLSRRLHLNKRHPTFLHPHCNNTTAVPPPPQPPSVPRDGQVDYLRTPRPRGASPRPLPDPTTYTYPGPSSSPSNSIRRQSVHAGHRLPIPPVPAPPATPTQSPGRS